MRKDMFDKGRIVWGRLRPPARGGRIVQSTGFTLLELLLVLVIISAVLALSWPQLGGAVRQREKQRFLYAMGLLASESWRRAQLEEKEMHILFDADAQGAKWVETNLSVSYPPGYRPLETNSWSFKPDSRPQNPPVLLVSSKRDTILVTSLQSRRESQ